MLELAWQMQATTEMLQQLLDTSLKQDYPEVGKQRMKKMMAAVPQIEKRVTSEWLAAGCGITGRSR